MKIYGINPNCSELVVRLGLDPDDEEGIRKEIREIITKSKLVLRVQGVDHPVNPDTIYLHQTARGDAYESHDYRLMVDGLSDGTLGSESKIKVRELEQAEGEIELFFPDYNSKITFTRWGETDDLVIHVSDCDREFFPAMAELSRAMGYKWHPYDGGHADGFEEWCRENGYQDVLGNYGW